MRSVKEIMRVSAELNSNGVHIGGSDRESNHSYGDAYESLFTIPDAESDLGDVVRAKYPYSIRNDVKLVMEVGVADGSCLLAWREVFPKATVVGIDIHPSDKAHGDRIEFHLGDQRVREDCDRAAAGRQFDLIVDDGTHLIEDSLRTLFWLWPYVRSGGLYVVEDGALQDCDRVRALFPFAKIVETRGPFGGVEPLVVFRRPR